RHLTLRAPGRGAAADHRGGRGALPAPGLTIRRGALAHGRCAPRGMTSLQQEEPMGDLDGVIAGIAKAECVDAAPALATSRRGRAGRIPRGRFARVLASALVLARVATAAGPPTVVFLSDFGTRDDAVAICKGVMLQVVPTLRVIDLTHDVTPF